MKELLAEPLGQITLLVLGAIVGTLLSEVASAIKKSRRTIRELRENLMIDLSGEWFAAWQVSIEGVEKINVEPVLLKQQGGNIAINNLKKVNERDGGYYWEGRLEFIQGRELIGSYSAKKEELVLSRGCLFYAFFSQRKVMIGKWTGTAHDGDLQSGLAVIAKTRTEAKSVASKLCQRKDIHTLIINFSYIWSDV